VIQRGTITIQLLFWGDESRLKDVPVFWNETRFRDP
jgi:hypothetical protein